MAARLRGYLTAGSAPAARRSPAREISPSSTVRTDRNAATFRGVIIFLLALITSAFAALKITHGALLESAKACGGVLLVSVALGLITATLSTWARFHVARIWLSARGKIPWRIMQFLDDAHARGVLRQAGPVCQFRHVRLQEQLSGRKKSQRSKRDILSALPVRRAR